MNDDDALSDGTEENNWKSTQMWPYHNAHQTCKMMPLMNMGALTSEGRLDM
jgi:hypothetical protein